MARTQACLYFCKGGKAGRCQGRLADSACQVRRAHANSPTGCSGRAGCCMARQPHPPAVVHAWQHSEQDLGEHNERADGTADRSGKTGRAAAFARRLPQCALHACCSSQATCPTQLHSSAPAPPPGRRRGLSCRSTSWRSRGGASEWRQRQQEVRTGGAGSRSASRDNAAVLPRSAAAGQPRCGRGVPGSEDGQLGVVERAPSCYYMAAAGGLMEGGTGRGPPKGPAAGVGQVPEAAGTPPWPSLH